MKHGPSGRATWRHGGTKYSLLLQARAIPVSHDLSPDLAVGISSVTKFPSIRSPSETVAIDTDRWNGLLSPADGSPREGGAVCRRGISLSEKLPKIGRASWRERV